MADINFDCPHCGQNLDAPDDMAGWMIECPACGGKIKIPVPEGMAIPDAVDTTASDDKGTTGIIDEEVNEESRKQSTVRIDVPKEFLMPAPKQRLVTIKRK